MADTILNTTAEKLEAAANRPITASLSSASSDDETPTAKSVYTLNTQTADSVMKDAAAARVGQNIERASDGHFYPIIFDSRHTMEKIVLTDGVEKPNGSLLPSSDYILCSKNLCVLFSDSAARCFLYFYSLNESGEFELRWDILSTTTSQNVKNYLNSGHVPSGIISNIPDGVYMKICVDAGEVSFYGWDGEMFGMPLSADTSVPINDSDYEAAFPTNGSVGVTVPGTAEFVLCKNAFVTAIFSVAADGSVDMKNHESPRIRYSFVKLPKGYDFFRLRLHPENGETTIGDVSNMISAVIPNVSSETAAGRSAAIIESCKKVAGIKWSPKVNLLVNGSYSRYFGEGVIYNGLPYGSEWEIPHYLGWHISPHTFVNAANDEQSIFYTQKVTNNAPYYGLVCSAFTTLCAGWPYPQTNAGFLYDPNVDVSRASRPPIGDIYTNLNGGHCLIPERIDSFGGITAISAYESVTPLSMRTTRYSNITDTTKDQSGYNVNYNYYNQYGYIADHKAAQSTIAAPYADFDDVTIVGGSARPHKGDRSVYTSNEAVLVNIKNTAATMLYVEKDGEVVVNYALSDAAQVDITGDLSGDGIYYVYTDISNVRESFEYHEVSEITCTITNGVPSFSDNDFWYAACMVKGSPLYVDEKGALQGMICCIPAREEYSAWANGPARITSARAVFRKGTYGAYVVPIENVYE